MDYNKPESKAKRRELRNNSTNAENALWELIRNRQIGNIKFRRQFGIGKYVVDFFSTEAKLVIEIDGEAHDSDESKNNDLKRQIELEDAGFNVLRFTNDEVLFTPEVVLEKIREALDRLLNRERL